MRYELPATAKFCRSCGAKQNQIIPEPSITQSSVSPSALPVPPIRSDVVTSDTKVLLNVKLKKKSPLVAALLNIFLSGIGNYYCKNIIGGTILFVLALLLLLFEINNGGVDIGYSLLIGAAIYGYIDAFSYNKKIIKEAISVIDN